MTPEQQSRFPSIPALLKNDAIGHLRPLTLSDGPALAEFYAAITWGEFRHYTAYPLSPLTAARIASEALGEFRSTIVLTGVDGRIGGYAWFQWKEGARESVFGICVRREFQNVGAGAALMRRIADVGKEVGPAIMSLTVQLANARAVALYQKQGFKIVREQMRPEIAQYGFFAEPEYYMERATR